MEICKTEKYAKQRKGWEAGKVGPRHERGSSTDWRELLISGERWEGLLMEEAWLQLSPEGQKWVDARQGEAVAPRPVLALHS